MKIETQVQIVITLTEEEARRVLTDPEEMQDTIRAKLAPVPTPRTLLPDPKGEGQLRRKHKRVKCPKCGMMVVEWMMERGRHKCLGSVLDVK